MKKPIIGVSGSLIIDSSGSFAGYRRSYVNHDYILSVLKNGGIPFIIPFSEDMDVIKSQMEYVDALLLSGGQDVYPHNYQEEPMQKIGDVFPERDDFDFQLIQSAMQSSKPILGICRGMQILNTYFGGSLYQDLSYIPGEIFKHSQGGFPQQVTHSVQIEKGSRLFRIFDSEELMVNSFHHQAVKSVGKELRVSARAKDGVVEAVEHVSYPFLVAVQWHPEMLHQSRQEMNKLFSALIRAI